MLNTQTTPATNGNTPTPANSTTIPTLDLVNAKDTFGNLMTAFDDVVSVVGLLLNDTLGKRQQHALLRLLQSHAYDYALLCQSEYDALGEYLADTTQGGNV